MQGHLYQMIGKFILLIICQFQLYRSNIAFEPTIYVRQKNYIAFTGSVVNGSTLTELYHIGPSIEDRAKKWFVFSRMNVEVGRMLQILNM